MALLKRIFPKRKQDQPVTDSREYAIPRLVRKKKSKKVALPKPQPVVLGIILEHFQDPALPAIVLRPATPPEHIFDVQERLFERSGSVFILRKEEAFAHNALAAQQLQVPAKHRMVQVREGLPRIDECDEPDESKEFEEFAESEESDDSGVGLDEECEADYRAYVAGMDGEI